MKEKKMNTIEAENKYQRHDLRIIDISKEGSRAIATEIVEDSTVE